MKSSRHRAIASIAHDPLAQRSASSTRRIITAAWVFTQPGSKFAIVQSNVR
jgi:hypothetical protein